MIVMDILLKKGVVMNVFFGMIARCFFPPSNSSQQEAVDMLTSPPPQPNTSSKAENKPGLWNSLFSMLGWPQEESVGVVGAEKGDDDVWGAILLGLVIGIIMASILS